MYLVYKGMLDPIIICLVFKMNKVNISKATNFCLLKMMLGIKDDNVLYYKAYVFLVQTYHSNVNVFLLF